MIVKELDAFVSQDKFAKAGRTAEEQMAFYLRRAFADDKKLHVLNGLRLEKDGDAAQIDHLLIHEHGMIIIESKSVTTRIQVNEHGEWARGFNGTLQGMPSPIQQAKRQSDFLRNYLEEHVESLLRKFLGFQIHFTKMPIDILVAVSDSGIIDRSTSNPPEKVCKADYAPDRIRNVLEKRRQANNLFNLTSKEVIYSFSEASLERVLEFLLKHHRPLVQPVSEPPLAEMPKLKTPQSAPPTQAATPMPKVRPSLEFKETPQPKKAVVAQAQPQSCQHCHSSSLSVEYGKYGYYLKCSECSGNNSIKAVCPACNAKAKIRKSGKQFFAECASCGTSTLFHTNP
ncbi:nuclease-related domain-containing protein [Trichocoleus sp. FACHB-262]|uniref:nuclease-related domain-containing protein n=1 Tax=Trichocoleus sp. FACHB-262 TaxID=2692869 RepID=UPI0016871E88|nr:nuclease-related domain-containing protein [Trichocoleus sp. FACHB-262]MBD2122094.1 NERD domain-containing protein [Trichocoleus sp. FACHB-262]